MTRVCSQYFMKKMYQVPIDISASRIMTPRATQSGWPCGPFHRAARPYGLLVGVVAAAVGGGAAGAGAAGAAAVGLAVPGVPWAGAVWSGVPAGFVAFGVAGCGAVWPAGCCPAGCAYAWPTTIPDRRKIAAAIASFFDIILSLLRRSRMRNLQFGSAC